MSFFTVHHIYIATEPPALSASKVGFAQLEHNAHILSIFFIDIPKISTEHFDANVRSVEQIAGEQLSGEQFAGEQLSSEQLSNSCIRW